MIINLMIVFAAITLIIIITLAFYFILPKTKFWYNNVTKYEQQKCAISFKDLLDKIKKEN